MSYTCWGGRRRAIIMVAISSFVALLLYVSNTLGPVRHLLHCCGRRRTMPALCAARRGQNGDDLTFLYRCRMLPPLKQWPKSKGGDGNDNAYVETSPCVF